MGASHTNANPGNGISASSSFWSGYIPAWAILHHDTDNTPVFSSEQYVCALCMLAWLFVISCHLSRCTSVTRPSCSCKLPKLPGCGDFRMKSVIPFCVLPWAGIDKSWACDDSSWARWTWKPFCRVSTPVVSDILVYHNTAMQVLD